MRRQTRGSTGRRGTAVAASAAALCLGTGLLSGCGSGPGDGYTAVGAAAGSSKPPSDGAPPGDVTLTPLDENGNESGSGGAGGRGRGGGGTSPSGGTSPGAGLSGAGGSGDAQDGSGGARAGTPGGPQTDGSSGGPGAAPSQPAAPSAPSKTGGSGGTGSPPDGVTDNPSPPGPGTPSSPKPPAPPATPAALTLSAPQRAAADKRWCEKVTVEFRNTGGSPARSGTVTFATHIIGALGVDWATITSSQPLPAPIDARSTRSKTYTVCVESWRVPPGMRVETQDVSAVWE
ncbi:hypothetical protein [Streptomyces globisporus]|uniref:Uncharacterized protein n=1 Tax=Streptomyces globisporus TaxID=1908 RepID=A0A423V4Q7_STRGL|nr:hypothetical protein [Streptomyces globisporus]ROV69581.1 hypothetical protein D3105_05320 [Streptomyces globisporus]